MSLPGERLASKDLVRVDVLVASARHDVGWEGRGRTRFVPTRGFEPVADVLLVERRLRMPRRVSLGRPVARAVRGQDFIDESERTATARTGDPTDLELRIRQDQATVFSVTTSVGV